MKKIAYVICLVGIMAAPLFSQLLLTTSPFTINFDYARFRHSDSTIYVEFYFAVFPHLTTYRQVGEAFEGAILLDTEIRSKLTGDLFQRERRRIPLTARDSAGVAARSTLISQMGYSLPPGEYDFRIVASDSLNRGRCDTVSISTTMRPFGPGLVASDIELCSSIRESSDKEDLFYKNAYEVVPNPTLVFGTSSNPVIFHYLELYDIDPNQEYILKIVILDVSGKPIQENVKKRKYKIRNSVEVGTTSVVKLASGRYRLQVIVLSQSSEPITKTEKVFYAYNPQVTAPVLSDAKLVESELNGLTGDELAEEFRMAQYHATKEETKTFAQISSLEGRREYLGTFWADVAKGRAGRSGITRSDYLNRARKANERFGAFSRPGWQTDRGRVLMLYGEPDDIERYPSTTQVARPYELWRYFDIESGVVFVFVDRTGFGDYSLVHSTKRGELWDDAWQRLLQ